MNSRKRFKADISTQYAQDIVKRRLPNFKFKQVPREDEDKDIADPQQPVISTIRYLPPEMLPQKKPKERNREYDKPEHWVVPEKPPKPSRDEVFKVERDNIAKRIKQQRCWSRAANQLDKAMTELQPSEAQDRDEVIDRVVLDCGPQNLTNVSKKRKNYSREFLQTFFNKARTLSAESEIGKRNVKTVNVKKIPKLASGIKPGADEIVL